MTECGPKMLARVHDRSRTLATRQVLVEKLQDDVFVKILRIQPALAHPPAKVSKAAEVSYGGRRRIAAAAEISLVDTRIGRQRSASQLAEWISRKLYGRSHRGLLKLLTKLQKTEKLCEVPAPKPSPQISSGGTFAECTLPNFHMVWIYT
jgi:hypothetical protein